jgi:hypothetical protein
MEKAPRGHREFELGALGVVLALFAACAAAESLAGLDELTWKTERFLDRPAKGYRCGNFEPSASTARDVVEAANDARSRGQHVFFCSSYLKDLKDGSELPGSEAGATGVVVFVNEDGVPRPPHWGHPNEVLLH